MTRKQLLKLLADMLFSYVNKDEDVPHGLEVEAVTKTCELLLKERADGTYGPRFYESVMDRMQRKRWGNDRETPDCTGCKYITHSLNSAPCKFCFRQRLDTERDYHTGRLSK